MNYIKKYWTKDRCLEVGLKCKTKKEFKDKYPGAYTACRRGVWLDEVWKNMIPIGNSFKRCIYAYEFSDNCVYIGLTYDLVKRDKMHNMEKYNSIVLQHKKSSSLLPRLVKLTDYLDKEVASRLEGETIDNYIKNGWTILNKAKPGSLGGHTTIWTKDKCLEAGLKCRTKNEFVRNYRGAYQASKINGWLDEIHQNMDEIIKPKNYWTKDRCLEIGLKCKTKKEMKEISISAYQIAHRNGWLSEIFPID